MYYALKVKEGIHEITDDQKATYENLKYGMLVEVLNREDSGYHSGCKVHFFNKKGVLVGNRYEFVTYDSIRLRKNGQNYPRFFMGKNYLKKTVPVGERFKTWLFIGYCNILTSMIKFAEKIVD